MGAPQIAHAQKATSDVHEFLMSACQTKRAIDFEAQGGNIFCDVIALFSLDGCAGAGFTQSFIRHS